MVSARLSFSGSSFSFATHTTSAAMISGWPMSSAALVVWVAKDKDDPEKTNRALCMFFAYLATLWFGCSNAAQEIVKEIAIYRRERLVGVGAHSYLASKYLFLVAVTAAQALVLYLTMLIGSGGRDGAALLQCAALFGTAIAAVGIGLTISALSRSVMQAVMFVPLILIPQILFSGYTVAPGDMTKSVLAISRLMPTFSAQTVMDTSFLWQREAKGDILSDHHQAFVNLDPEHEIATGDVYDRGRPAVLALLAHALWGVVTYFVAWFALKKRERV